MIKNFLIVVILLVSQSAYALTPKEEKGVKVLKSPSLAYEAPTWVAPVPLEQASEDLEDWLKILPFEQDKNADLYVVLPTIGVISPVIFVPEGTSDYKQMTAGKQIEINNYLDRGVMHYPKTGMPGDAANPVIFGHSNFFKDGVGDYKTIFADIMNLDVSPRDEMWTYTREENGEYILRKFEISESFETEPTNVSVMIPKGGKEITVFACTDGLAGRWILKGHMIEDDEVLVPYPTKWKYIDLMESLGQKDAATKQKIISEVLSKIENVRDAVPNSNTSYHDKFKKYMLNYMEKELLLQG